MVPVDMSQETIMKLAGIMTGETYSLWKMRSIAGRSEIGNIISGNAITEINNKQKGLNIRLAPPSVFAGDGLNMFNVRLNSWSVLLDSDAGPIKINVAAREGK
jgi:chemotaxis protein CheX